MKKKWLSIAAIAAALLLTGCSSGETEKADSPAKESTTEQAASKDYSFYQDAKENERIYYKLDLDDQTFGKDSKIEGILHVKKGDYAYYFINKNHTMADLKDLSDTEILTAANDWSEQAAHDLVEKAKQETQELLDDASVPNRFSDATNEKRKNVANQNIELLDNYKYEKPEFKKLQIKAESDSSGNNLEKEWIVLPTNDFRIKYMEPNDWDKDQSAPDLKTYYDAKLMRYQLSPTQNTADVYEKTYNISSFGSKSTMATLHTGEMKLDDLSEKGLLDKDAGSKYYKSVYAPEVGGKRITWE